MSTLYRAKPKSREDLPEQTRCCEKQIEATLAMGEMVIDVSRKCKAQTECRWCGFKRPKDEVHVTSGKYWVSFDELEIWEKPVEAE